MTRKLKSLTDDELIAAINRLVKQRSHLTAELIEHIGEFDARRLYAKHACSSTFAYCQRLGLSESSAYKHMTVAKAARSYPFILELLRAGETHLSNLVMLVRHLNEANHRELLAAAKGKSKRQMKLLVAEWFPKDPVPPRIRKRPSPRTSPAPAPVPTPTTEPSAAVPRVEPWTLTMPTPAATPPGKVEPLAPALFKVEFTADQQFYDDIEEARALLGPRLPRGELSELFRRAVRLLVESTGKHHGKGGPSARRTSPTAASARAMCRTRSSARWPSGTVGSAPLSTRKATVARSVGASSCTTRVCPLRTTARTQLRIFRWSAARTTGSWRNRRLALCTLRRRSPQLEHTKPTNFAGEGSRDPPP